MAIIPTYTAEGGLPAGGTGPQANPAAYAAPARALAGLGETIGQTGNLAGKIGVELFEQQKQRQDQDDAFWASSTASDLTRKFIEFSNDTNNSSRSDFGQAFKAYSDTQLAEAVKSAPSQKAGRRLQLLADNSVNQFYENSLKIGESNRNFGIAESLKKNVLSISEGISTLSTNPNMPFPEAAYQMQIQAMYDQVDGLPFSNQLKSKFRSSITTELAVGTMRANPEFAKSIVDASRDLDTEQKSTLYNKIETQVRSRNQFQVAIVNDGLVDGLSIAQKDNKPFEINLDQYRPMFDGDQEFGLWKKQWTDKISAHNGAVYITGKVAGFNPDYQDLESNKMQQSIQASGQAKLQIETTAAAQLKALRQAYNTDPVTAIKQYNPLLKPMVDNLAMMEMQNAQIKDPESAKQTAIYRSKVDETIWKLQGGYDDKLLIDGKPVDQRYFQNKPEGERRLLENGKAKQLGGQMLQGDWKARITAYSQLANDYPNLNYFAVAINDIERAMDGNRAEMQRVLIAGQLNKNGQSALAEIVGRPNATQILADFKDKDDIKKAFDRNTIIKDSLMTLRGASAENPELASGYEDAIKIIAANGMITKAAGFENATAAVQTAYNEVIGKTMPMQKTVSLTGGRQSNLMININRVNSLGQIDPSLGQRGPDDLFSIAAFASVEKEKINAEDFELFDISGNPVYAELAPSIYAQQGVTKNWELLKNAIRSNGFWVSTPDGQGAVFYMAGKAGLPFAPVNKITRQPYKINFADFETGPKIREYDNSRDPGVQIWNQMPGNPFRR
jgi:hypothetical protein